MKQLDYGKGYQYAHDEADGVADMDCLPEQLAGPPLLRADRARLREGDQAAARWVEGDQGTSTTGEPVDRRRMSRVTPRRAVPAARSFRLARVVSVAAPQSLLRSARSSSRLAPRDSQHHGPAVRAHGRIGGRPQLLQDVPHLLDGRAGRCAFTAAWQAMVAAIRLTPRSTRQAAIEALEVLGQRAQRAIARRRRQQAGTAVIRRLAPPKSSRSKPKRASRRRAPAASRGPAGQFEHHRHQQPLALERPRRAAAA